MCCIRQKIDGSAKIRCVSKNLLSYQNTWWWLSKRQLSKQKFAVSAKISWFGKICCVSEIWLVSTNTWWWLSKNMLYQKSLTSQRNELIQQKYAVSARTCWVIKMPDDDSTKESCVSKNLLSQQKSADLRRDLPRSTTMYFGTTSSNVYCVWTLSGIWFLSATAEARTLTVVLTSSI